MKFKVGDIVKIKSGEKSYFKGFEPDTIHIITRAVRNCFSKRTNYELDGSGIYAHEYQIELIGVTIDAFSKVKNQENSQDEIIKYKIQNA